MVARFGLRGQTAIRQGPRLFASSRGIGPGTDDARIPRTCSRIGWRTRAGAGPFAPSRCLVRYPLRTSRQFRGDPCGSGGTGCDVRVDGDGSAKTQPLHTRAEVAAVRRPSLRFTLREVVEALGHRVGGRRRGIREGLAGNGAAAFPGEVAPRKPIFEYHMDEHLSCSTLADARTSLKAVPVRVPVLQTL